MFSQFRQAVEGLASDNPSLDASSRSPDPLRQSSAPLAENAFTTLRKSIAVQRAASPVQQTSRPRSASPGSSSSARNMNDSGLRKTTLEERLRASFAASESQPGSASNQSRTGSPTPPHSVPVTQHPLSPAFTPPPDYPGTPLSAPDTLVVASIQAEEHEHIDDTSVSDPTQPPGSIPVTDSQPIPTHSTAHSIHTDPAADPCASVSPDALQNVLGPDLTQEATPLTDTGAQQSATQQSNQASDLLAVETESSGEGNIDTEPQATISQDASVDALQERLKLVEQRFGDVSTSFKKLQVERRELDGVISELTPLEGSKDVAALREYLANLNSKTELSQDELQRLNGKLTRHEERYEELRETYRLETALQSDQIEKLRRQLTEAEALITASQSVVTHTEEDNAKRDADLERLRADAAKASDLAKEEEEKRVKAISLLKTVRQKLVRAEKERDDILRELNEARGKNLEEKEKDRAERANLEREVNTVNAEREKVIAVLRAQFDKDITAEKERAERDIQTVKRQFDTEMNAQKNSHYNEISAKKLRIGTLEDTVASLTGENRSFFEQLELRQAELESSQCHAESMQAQNTELQFQLKELQERIALLADEVSELRGEHEMRSQVTGVPSEDISQLVSSIEFKYEAKLSELKRALSTIEKERTEAEATWSRKLTEKTKETEDLKRMLQSSIQLREQDEDKSGTLKAEIEKLQTETRSQHGRLYELQKHIDASKDAESTLHRRLSEATARVDDGEKLLEESKSRETQLRAQSKTLRDELRKVQNSVAILERQRNPGAGYWSSREASDSRTSISSIPDSSSSPLPTKNEEEINYEYLRNIIIQFLEHKEMRPNLVRVLSTILRFTPQETRRLMSKV